MLQHWKRLSRNHLSCGDGDHVHNVRSRNDEPTIVVQNQWFRDEGRELQDLTSHKDMSQMKWCNRLANDYKG